MVNTITSQALDEVVRQMDSLDEADSIRCATEWRGKIVGRDEGKPYTHYALGQNLEFRPGELTIWGGLPGSGKSQLVGQYALWGAADGKRTTIASLEMPVPHTLERMIRQTQGEVSARAEAEFFAGIGDSLWVYDELDSVEARRLLAMTHYAASELGCTQIVIDSLTKAGLAQDGEGWLTQQVRFVDSLQQAVKKLNVEVHLVCHLRKGAGTGRRDMHDIRGAGQITDLADRVLLLHRNVDKERVMWEAQTTPEQYWTDQFRNQYAKYKDKSDALLQCEKQRFNGWIGDVKLTYHHKTGQFIPHKELEAMRWLKHASTA